MTPGTLLTKYWILQHPQIKQLINQENTKGDYPLGQRQNRDRGKNE
jgi:hypothetical protein